MEKNRRCGIMILFALLCVFVLTPISANAAKLKTVNVDKYLGLGKKYTVLAYNNNKYNLKVYKKKSLTKGTYGKINYGAAVIVNTSKLKKGTKTAWIPVYMHNKKTKAGYTTAYLRADKVKLHALYTKNYSDNSVIDKAIKAGFKYLGTPFQLPGASLTGGIDCAQFVSAVYQIGGRRGLGTHTNYLQAACRQIFYNRKHKALSKSQLNKMKPGDLLFYLANDVSGPIDHVAIYIGDGFMINSSGHYGSTYPNGGICIKRVQYGNRKIVRCMRLKGY